MSPSLEAAVSPHRMVCLRLKRISKFPGHIPNLFKCVLALRRANLTAPYLENIFLLQIERNARQVQLVEALHTALDVEEELLAALESVDGRHRSAGPVLRAKL